MLSLTHPTRVIFTAITLLISFMISAKADAALVSYSSDSVDLVYSSISDVTWTKNANLLQSMIAGSDFDTVVNSIIVANASTPIGSLPYTLTESDFSSDGATSWYGAMAFVNYLNNINYGGASNWRLPTVIDIGNDGCNLSGDGDCGYNTVTNGTIPGYEMAELYYSELGSEPFCGDRCSGNYGINSPLFTNTEGFYWSGTEVGIRPDDAFIFFASYGFQQDSPKYNGYAFWKAWAVSPGSIIPVDVPPVTSVPEPRSAWLFLGGALLLFAAQRRSTHYRAGLSSGT
jgi:hypothetical protein